MGREDTRIRHAFFFFFFCFLYYCTQLAMRSLSLCMLCVTVSVSLTHPHCVLSALSDTHTRHGFSFFLRHTHTRSDTVFCLFYLYLQYFTTIVLLGRPKTTSRSDSSFVFENSFFCRET